MIDVAGPYIQDDIDQKDEIDEDVECNDVRVLSHLELNQNTLGLNAMFKGMKNTFQRDSTITERSQQILNLESSLKTQHLLFINYGSSLYTECPESYPKYRYD